MAEEQSSLGNGPGHSTPITFVVNTAAPEVSLEQVPSPSSNTKPSFSGTASELSPVIVKIYKGTKGEGTVVATAESIVLGGNWGPASSATVLASATYTAVAEETSLLGNATGKSEARTFVINTEPPEVSLAAWCRRRQTTRRRRSAGPRANRCR